MKQWLSRRGVVAILPVASLVLGFGACSSETGAPEELADADAGASVQSDGAKVFLESPAAKERLTKLSQRFIRIPAQLQAEPPLRVPPGVTPPRPAPALEPLAPSPVLKRGDASRFLRQGSRVRAEVSAAIKEQARTPATVDLPLSASGFVRVQPDKSPFGVEFATQGALKNVELEVSEGTASYPGAAPGGGDLVLRVTAEGVEDFIVLKQKPAHDYVDYFVNVSEVPGLRHFDNSLEFLGADGDPHLRIRSPQVIDADGTIHPAKLELQGCAADTSGLPPWNRPVTAPGKSECTVRVSWAGAKLVYPAIVDPVWTTAGSLGTARYRNPAVRLSTGFVLTCGGIGDLGIAMNSCEQFNPAGGGGTGTWAATTSMGTARSDFSLVLLSPATTVLAVGGNAVSTSERFNGSTWTASVGDFSTGYFNPQMPALTSDGAYVVMVSYDSTPYRYTVSTNTWSVGTAMVSASPYRYSAAIVQIPGQNTILRAGGYYNSYYATAERYRPSTDSWSTPGAAASMTVPRADAAVAILDGNRVMVYGGYTGAAQSSTAEIYNGSSNTWSFTAGNMPGSASQYYRGVTAAFHGSGKLFTNADGGTFLYDPAAASASWTQIQTYSASFYSIQSQGSVASAGAKVLLVPVQPQSAPSGPQTACRLFDFGEKGAACSTTGECQSGLTCVQDWSDGSSVCCDSACGDRCSACKATNKTSGTGDGSCGPRKANQYVGYDFCPSTEVSTCGTTGGYCDGAGACAVYSSQYQCGNASCLDADTQNNVRSCDGAGSCTAQTTTNCATGYQCNYGLCQTECYNDTDYCTANSYCQTWSDPVTPYYKCYPKKNDGASCQSPSECKKGNCVDGVCCDTACTGLCQACTMAQTGQTTGSCKPNTTGTDPQSDCSDNGSASCGQNGSCNGAGACQIYASGTVCVAATCASATSRSNQDTCNGTGTCVDNLSTNCAAGYACVSGVCQTTCTADTQCASTHYCETSTSQCVTDKPQGGACARDAACTGNANCIDGVCCDSACAGACRSCLKNQTGLDTNGLCGDILDDTDPANECATGAAYPNSCQAPGLCNGQGACRPYAKTGIECDADECADSTLTSYECNGAGSCKTKSTLCYPFKCDVANAVCRVACSTNTHCVTGSFCDSGTCVGQLGNGKPCTAGAQCGSGFCANIGEGTLAGEDTGAGGAGAGGAGSDPGADSPGVCCDEECQGTCKGCKASIKGVGSDGVCEFVRNNTDPANDCDPEAGAACGLDGQCNGSGACRQRPFGSACGATSCQGNSLLGQQCDGTGNCINNQAGIDCAAYLCREIDGAFQCNTCTEDAHCSDGYYCSDSICSKKLANGKACEINGVCNSGYCVDGVCCDASCNGQCEACAAPGSEGTCTPVQGEPQGSRAKCDFAGEECGGRCDGVNAAACKYTPNGEACGTPACESGLASSSACNGQGACKQNPEEECSPYTCDDADNTCRSRCEVDEDCSQGYACDETAQRCLPSATAAVCSEDRFTSVGQNGSTPCKPFLCVPASGSCAVSCAFTTDCSPDFVCESSTKTCLPAPPDTTPADEACACRTVGGRPNQNGLFALALFGFGLIGLRRRSHKSSTRAATHLATPAA